MKGTILVVDDDAGLRQTIASILEDDGYSVLLAADGLSALEVLQNVRPSAILLDINMPQMDGYQFADELQRRGLRPGIPVMVLTADGRAPERATRIGAEAHLPKPFSLVALLDGVDRLVQSRT